MQQPLSAPGTRKSHGTGITRRESMSMRKEEKEEMRTRQEQRRTKKPPETEREDDKKIDKNSWTIEPAMKNKAKAVLFVP